jgi:hypothetical protein
MIEGRQELASLKMTEVYLKIHRKMESPFRVLLQSNSQNMGLWPRTIYSVMEVAIRVTAPRRDHQSLFKKHKSKRTKGPTSIDDGPCTNMTLCPALVS